MIGINLKKYVVRVLVAAFAMVVIAWIVFKFFIPAEYIQVLPWMLAFFTFLTIFLHGYQIRLINKDMGRFTRSSMIISMLRLLIYSVFAIIYLIKSKDNVTVFIICLVLVYMVYTVLEIKNITSILKHSK